MKSILEKLYFVKKRLQDRSFAVNTVNFEKLLKALCRIPPVSASNFNSSFLTLRPRKTCIYAFPTILYTYIFLSQCTPLIEARNKSTWFYTKSGVNQAIFDIR